MVTLSSRYSNNGKWYFGVLPQDILIFRLQETGIKPLNSQYLNDLTWPGHSCSLQLCF